MKNDSSLSHPHLSPSQASAVRDTDAERMAFLKDLPSVSYADLLPNYDGTSWFVKTEAGPFNEVLFQDGERESKKLNVDDVVLLRSGSLLGDGKRFFRFNCEGQKVMLTPVHAVSGRIGLSEENLTSQENFASSPMTDQALTKLD